MLSLTHLPLVSYSIYCYQVVTHLSTELAHGCLIFSFPLLIKFTLVWHTSFTLLTVPAIPSGHPSKLLTGFIVAYLLELLLSVHFLLVGNMHLLEDNKKNQKVFANGPGDLGSIPGRVIPKTLKMELDTTLLNTQHYKVRFKGKVEQS